MDQIFLLNKNLVFLDAQAAYAYFFANEKDPEVIAFVASIKHLPKKYVAEMLSTWERANPPKTVGSIVERGSFYLFEVDNETYEYVGFVKSVDEFGQSKETPMFKRWLTKELVELDPGLVVKRPF
jgi:hypothetical protein